MAYTYVSAGAVYKGASSSSMTPAYPGSIAAGDLLLMAFYARAGDNDITIPSGWTDLSTGNGDQYGLIGKIAAGTESGTLTVPWTNNPTADDCYAQIARFTGGPSSGLAAHASAGTSGTPTSGLQDIRTPAMTVTEAGCLVVVMGGKRVGGSSTLPYTVTLSSFTKIGEEEDTAGATSSFVWAYSIQTTATSLTQDDDGFDTANTSTGDSVTRAVAIVPGVTTTKYLKLLADSSAASATGVEVVVYSAPGGSNYVTGTTRYGSAESKSFEASLESGNAVLKVLASDVGCDGLAAATSVRALAQNTIYTTGMVSATIIEE